MPVGTRVLEYRTAGLAVLECSFGMSIGGDGCTYHTEHSSYVLYVLQGVRAANLSCGTYKTQALCLGRVFR